MIGKSVLHYKILNKLGEGGMGVVYEAEDTKLERTVAIKFLPRQITASDEERERFKIEARAAAALNHNNIATIHAIEESDEETFIVMEYIKGQELKDRIEAGPLPLDDTLNLAVQIAQGLQAAHEAGVIHRDIKSANIMLSEKGDVRIMDFGLAKLGGQTKLTKEGTTLGTIAYMSPEQTKGEEVDGRSDLFSLGVLIYEMICGQMPFKGDYDQAVAYSILNEDPEPVSGLRSGIPLEFERIITKCLEKDVALRYQSANDLIADLSKLKRDSDTQQLLSSQPGTREIETSKTKAARLPVPVIIFLGFVIFVAGYFIYTLLPRSQSKIRLTNPRQITSAIGVEQDPTWSPDGGRLAYTAPQNSGRSNIWVVQLGGRQAVNLTAGLVGDHFGPAWSPDGNQIAFWSNTDAGSLVLMPAVGGSTSNLGIPGSDAANRVVRRDAPVWINGEKQLAYVVRDTLDQFYIERLAIDSREKTQIQIPGRSLTRTHINRTQDGRAIAYVDAIGTTAETTQIWVLRTEDGQGFPVTDGRYWDINPIWSKDGRILYFISNRGGSRDLWQMSMDKAFNAKDTGQPITAGIGLRQAVFSADGTKLAYVKGSRIANLWRIRIPEPGQEPKTWADAKQITFDNAFIEYVDISRDGQTLFFSSDRLGNQDLWRMQADGTGLQQLTTDPTPDWMPILSPDGTEIAFYAYRSGNRDIWVLPAQGGAARQITTWQGPDFMPAWSQDGKSLAFTSLRSSVPEVWLVPAAGGSPVLLNNNISTELTTHLNPNGHVAFRGGGNHNGIWVAPALDQAPGRLPNTEDVENLTWAPDGNHIYFITTGPDDRELVEISLVNRARRTLTELQGRRYGNLAARALATDGEYLYFSWMENTGDLWVMDVVQGE